MHTCASFDAVAFTALVLKPFANFMQCADSVRLIEVISADRYAEIRSETCMENFSGQMSGDKK